MNDIRDDINAIRQAQFKARWEWEITVFLVICFICIAGFWLVTR